MVSTGKTSTTLPPIANLLQLVNQSRGVLRALNHLDQDHITTFEGNKIRVAFRTSGLDESTNVTLFFEDAIPSGFELELGALDQQPVPVSGSAAHRRSGLDIIKHVY